MNIRLFRLVVIFFVQFAMPIYGMSGLGWFKEHWPFGRSGSTAVVPAVSLSSDLTEMVVATDDEMPLLSDPEIKINTENITEMRTDSRSIDTYTLSWYRGATLVSFVASSYLLVNGYDQFSWLAGLSVTTLTASTLFPLLNDGMVRFLHQQTE